MKDSGAWFEALKDLTPHALENGLERLRSLKTGGKFSSYPPNCLEFKEICLAFYEDLKLPKLSDAYQEIKNRAYIQNKCWTHPVVKLIAKRLPIDFLKLDDEREAYALFKKIYEQACLLIRMGHVIPEIKEDVMLEKPKNYHTAKQHLDAMRKYLGIL